MPSPVEYNHLFDTVLGLPPDKSDKPLCGAYLPESWDWQGPRPPCPDCAKKRLGKQLARLESGASWFGYLARKNLESIHKRLQAMLADQRPYVWTAVNLLYTQPNAEVRVERVRNVATDITLNPERGITVHDSYGIWSLDAMPLLDTEREATRTAIKEIEQRRRTHQVYIHFDHGSTGEILKIQLYALAGNAIEWTVLPIPDHLLKPVD